MCTSGRILGRPSAEQPPARRGVRAPARTGRVSCAAARLLTLALTGAIVAAGVGCGNERPESGRLFDSSSRKGTRTLNYPYAGLTMALPRAYVVNRTRPPQVFRASLEDAFVSSFAYRREERLPVTAEQLRTARDRLVRAAQRRDRSFRLLSSRLTRAAGAPAIEVLGEQTISMGRLRLRSLHLYKGRAEYVIELAAPLARFERLDRSTFPGIRTSLRVTGEVRNPPAPKREGAKRGR